jgi:hypothetical protein
MQSQVSSAEKIGNECDPMYEALLCRVQSRFLSNIDTDGGLFTTDAEGLWELYLGSFPAETRQYHNCSACRYFITRIGALVTIRPDGTTESAVWNPRDADELHEAAFAAMSDLVRRAKVTGVFLSSRPVLGFPQTGAWRHLAATQPKARVYNSLALTAGQAMAEKLQDRQNVIRALSEFPRPLVDQALGLLKSDALYRAEKVIGPAQWLSDLHAAMAVARGPLRDNILWRFIGAAPAGFCHPRSSMFGTLLEDLAAGLGFPEASANFAKKMHPLAYQRPKAAPTAGNILQAEKLVEQMGIAKSLVRRYARFEECEPVWLQLLSESPSGGGVFGHLKPKGAPELSQISVPAQTITWEKFARTALREARSIEILVPSSGNFCAYVTAAHPDAPPILRWDSAERRNPVSLYVYDGGSPASQWGLRGGEYARVIGVTLRPSMWFGSKGEVDGVGALFVIEGAKDSRDSGCALFPEAMKPELHGIRSTIERFSSLGTIAGREEATANGILIGKAGAARVRVTTPAGVCANYFIDRWD